ncbi:AI-2E family transporter [bacterium]|nr:AI-2E family transporter [bacterium]MCB2179190.1 AI-2E family transporter [bacterium]
MEPKWSTQTRIFIISILLILFVAFLYFIRSLLGPVVIASLFAFMLYPVASFLHRRTRLSQKAAGIIVYFTFLALVATIPAVVTPIVINEIDFLSGQTVEVISGINDFLSGTSVLGYHIFSGIPAGVEDSITQALHPEQVYESIAAMTENLVWMGVIIILMYYLLVDWTRARNAVFSSVPQYLKRDAYELFIRLRHIWDVYLRGQLLTMTILGTLAGVAAAILGLPAAIILGLVAAAFGLVPSVGSSAFVVIAGLVALFARNGGFGLSKFWYVFIVVAVFIGIHLFENYYLRPRVLGQGLQLHPAVILISVLGALTLGGGLLALVVVPLISSVGVLLRYLLARLSDADPWKDNEEPLVNFEEILEED